MTEEQRRSYAENGYLQVPGLFAAAEFQPWADRFLAIVNGEVPPAPDMLVMRDVMVVRGAVQPERPAEAIAKIQDFHNDEVLFGGYSRHPKLLAWVENLVASGDIKSIHNMLINKPPGVDGRHPLHQDLLYFPFRPADQIVATWTALEPCTRENGCLVVVPGSHEKGLRKHVNPDWEYLNAAYFGVEDVGPETERVHLEMEAGDTVFFHPALLHGSGRNRTDGFRRAISNHYASATCRFIPGLEPRGEVRPYILVRGREQEGCI
ncbi:MAG: phytanoyl-CoA dioxygenase family protein [Myxococcota bacterium]